MAIISASGGASAADCPSSASGMAVSCPAATQQVLQQRLNRTLATDPLDQRRARLRAGGRAPAAQGAAPFSLAPAGDHATFATSLDHLSAYLTHSEMQKIESAKDLAPDGLRLPKPAAGQDPAMDIWARGRVAAGADTAADRQGHTSYVGADYRMGDDVVLGGMVQLDESETGIANQGTAAGGGYMAGPYMAWRLAPNLMLDAKMGWGQARDTLALNSGADTVTTGRRLTQTRLQGDWMWQGMRISPGMSVTVIEEATATGDEALRASRRTLAIGPELARPFSAGAGRTIEPFVHLKSSLSLDAAGAVLQGASPSETAEMRNTLGGGVAISKSDSYTVRATTDLENLNQAETDMRSRLQVTIPLDQLR